MQAVRKLTLRRLFLVLLAVALVVCLVLVALGFKTEKEGTVTTYVWVPDNAISTHDLFGEYLQLNPSYESAVLWKDTHLFGEYQKLNASVHFFVLSGSKLRYFAVLRNADGTVSAARTTVSPEIPAQGFWETRTVSFDPATGEVTAQYARSLSSVIVLGLTPLLIWLIGFLVTVLARAQWDEPLFSLKRASA